MLKTDVLRVIELGSRGRKPVTAHKVASLVDASLYKVRKVLAELQSEKFVQTVTIEHRPGLMKTCYTITQKGAYHLAGISAGYTVQPPLFDASEESLQPLPDYSAWTWKNGEVING